MSVRKNGGTGITVIILALILAWTAAAASGEGTQYVKPKERDKCPVCGMFVARYPDWTAEVVFIDGTYAVFDGVKDLLTFYFAVGTYAPGKGQKDIAALYVTDYYDVRPVNARNAFFVLGSDVYGPMGRELVPFASESDARQFQQDHGGKRVLRFREVTQEIVKELAE